MTLEPKQYAENHIANDDFSIGYFNKHRQIVFDQGFRCLFSVTIQGETLHVRSYWIKHKRVKLSHPGLDSSA